MNITDQFVFVHMPKTGGTFVSDCLRRIHGDRMEHWGPHGAFYWRMRTAWAGLLRRPLAHRELAKHANCRAIPEAAAGLPIYSSMRDPFDWYVSNYKFGYWRTHPDKYPGLREDPRWPDLSFADYIELSGGPWLQIETPDVAVRPDIGRLTTLFVNFYCDAPGKILAKTDDDAFRAALKARLYPVEFLEMARLNAETAAFLGRYYPPGKIAFVADKAKISPRNARSDDDTVAAFFSPALRAEILHRDRFLFEIFPQYTSA